MNTDMSSISVSSRREENRAMHDVVEVQGTTYTLFMGENTEVIFDVMEFVDIYSRDRPLRETMDVFSFWRMYE